MQRCTPFVLDNIPHLVDSKGMFPEAAVAIRHPIEFLVDPYVFPVVEEYIVSPPDGAQRGSFSIGVTCEQSGSCPIADRCGIIHQRLRLGHDVGVGTRQYQAAAIDMLTTTPDPCLQTGTSVCVFVDPDSLQFHPSHIYPGPRNTPAFSTVVDTILEAHVLASP